MPTNTFDYAVIVCGGGHAGVEAALAAARMGRTTLLVTSKISAIATMPCNPSIGGLAKSHLVHELDALGGEMGKNADATAVQSKILNRSRGQAVWATRCQCAKREYSERMLSVVRSTPNLTLLEDSVVDLLTMGAPAQINGVVTLKHGPITARTVVITAGTSLRGKIWIGDQCTESGGDNRPAVNQLSAALERLGHQTIRLKTGTPPRLLASSCDFGRCQRLDGEIPHPLFHHPEPLIVPRGTAAKHASAEVPLGTMPEMPCWMSHTNERSHQIIRQNLQHSAMYNGGISGTGVRYCPSIEDKIVRFKAASHHVILEPEDSEGKIIYPNGLSCCLPERVQEDLVHSVVGLEHAEFTAYAYAIEYDSIDSRTLKHSLESKLVGGLFFAGQINGTTGYEEAAAQGIMAGINAALMVNGEDPIVLSRQDAYIGVMIDDLVTKGTDEPYRIFTSRAERRLMLRQDNAPYRLINAARRAGIVPAKILEARERNLAWLEDQLKRSPLGDDDRNGLVNNNGEVGALAEDPQLLDELNIMRHYAPYIEQEKVAAEKARADEALLIPKWLDYKQCTAVRFESRQKLLKYRPENLAQASRIPGVNPADISILAVIIKRGHI